LPGVARRTLVSSDSREGLTTVEHVGVIGLGLMGNAIARRLVAGGVGVVGYDVTAAARDQAARAGVRVVPGAGEVFAACDVVVLSLPTSDVAEQVLGESAAVLRPNAVVIDTTTGDPDRMAALGERLAARGIRYLDATIAANSEQIARAEANIVAMVGGDAGAFAASEPLLTKFVGRAFHVGPCGHGGRMKLVTNLMLGLSRAVLAETLTFAGKCGLDRRAALEVLRAGNAYSRVMDTKGEKMLAGDFTPAGRLSQHLKDVRLILELGERVGTPLPLSELHRELLEACERAGLGGQDNCAVIRAFEDPRILGREPGREG
jgi:3-hydroxyisobutyrate dehydrogenase-like beta-hydroxyacid dehydrogenase